MLVVDTNIFAALFIRGRLSEQALELRSRDAVWCVDPFALVEFTNVLATYERARYLSAADTKIRLKLAEAFLSRNYFRAPNEAALEFALRYRTTAYDARFLVVAHHHRQRLVTDDGKLRKAAPALTQSIEEALARF